MPTDDGRQTIFSFTVEMKQQGFRRNASSAARLAAVQALYEVDVAGATVEYVLASFKEQRWASVQAELETEVTNLKEGGVHLPAPDRRVLPRVVRGVDNHQSDLDTLISAQMEAEDAFQQLEAIAKAILRSAAFELAYTPQVPIGVISADYVAIANSFFTENQPTLINAVIGSLVDKLRGDVELVETPPASKRDEPVS